MINKPVYRPFAAAAVSAERLVGVVQAHVPLHDKSHATATSQRTERERERENLFAKPT